MALPDAETLVPPVLTAGSAPGAPTVMPPEGGIGAAEGVVAAARPGAVRLTPTSTPTASPSASPMARNRGVGDVAGTPVPQVPMFVRACDGETFYGMERFPVRSCSSDPALDRPCGPLSPGVASSLIGSNPRALERHVTSMRRL